MPIEIGLWRVSNGTQKINFCSMDSENRLETILAGDLSILDPDLLLIGRQVPTAYGKFIDLLALDADAKLVVIELKKQKTPRDVVAQVLDYGSWVRKLEDDEIAGIYEAFLKKYQPSKAGQSLDDAFRAHFNVQEMPEALNEGHELVIVASELDDATERIINYLAEEYGVSINAVFFRFFQDGDSEYLTRAWLIDPAEAEAKSVENREKLPWNGEFYASFGGDENRDWEEARRYGFISAGGGSWYSRTLDVLEEGARVWVNMPGSGYVGVGRVIEKAQPIDTFLVDDGKGNQVPINHLPLNASRLTSQAKDPVKAEFLVRVKWIQTVSADAGIKEKGLFGNQNSAAKPRAKKWDHTVERLKARFGVKE